MRIAVTGKEGQVARSLMERGPVAGHDIILVGRPALDLGGDADSIDAALDAAKPDAIVSAAAYTMVDKAESEPELAFKINRDGAGAVARAAARIGVPLVHLSTDYVFDGTKPEPYVEADATGPVSVYGASKLAGELAVLEAHANSAVLRTAWVYSPFGANFVKTMFRLAVERDELQIVADQFGNPTSALDIADAVIRVATGLRNDSEGKRRGIFHLTANGEASWASFAEQIFVDSAELGGASARVRGITMAQYPTAARRPANSRLNCDLIEATYGLRLPDWHISLRKVVQRLLGKQEQDRRS